jgi:hypothetical protein
MKLSAPRACRAASADLPTRLVSDWMGPHPSAELVTFAAAPVPRCLTGHALLVPERGPRWGRSRAVNGRSASGNHREPRASSSQLSSLSGQAPQATITADSLSHRGSRAQILRPREDVAYGRLCRAVVSCRSARLGVAITADVLRIIGRLGREEAKQLDRARTPYQVWRGYQHEEEG